MKNNKVEKSYTLVQKILKVVFLVLAILNFLLALIMLVSKYFGYVIFFAIVGLVFMLFRTKLGKKVVEEVTQTHSEEIKEEKKEEKIVLDIPDRIDDCPKIYEYTDVKLTDCDYDNFAKVFDEKKKVICNVRIDNDIPTIYLEDERIGIVENERLRRMLGDWDRRKEPDFVALTGSDDETREVFVYLGFYRELGDRENTLVNLTHYKKEDIQTMLALSHVGEKVIFEEEMDENYNEYLAAKAGNVEIGRVPHKIAERLRNEDCYYAEIESLEIDDNLKFKPIVTIYW